MLVEDRAQAVPIWGMVNILILEAPKVMITAGDARAAIRQQEVQPMEEE